MSLFDCMHLGWFSFSFVSRLGVGGGRTDALTNGGKVWYHRSSGISMSLEEKGPSVQIEKQKIGLMIRNR